MGLITAKTANRIGDYLKARLAQEFRDQGHNLSGELIASLESRVETTGATVLIEMYANDYGGILNTGVSPARIPYTPGGPKRGGTSQYIQGLIRYAERRMNLQGKEAIGAAFAIARKQKREGMPTRGSYSYSKNGRRLGWVDVVLEETEKGLNDFVSDWVAEEITLLIHNFAKAKR